MTNIRVVVEESHLKDLMLYHYLDTTTLQFIKRGLCLDIVLTKHIGIENVVLRLLYKIRAIIRT